MSSSRLLAAPAPGLLQQLPPEVQEAVLEALPKITAMPRRHLLAAARCCRALYAAAQRALAPAAERLPPDPSSRNRVLVYCLRSRTREVRVRALSCQVYAGSVVVHRPSIETRGGRCLSDTGLVRLIAVNDSIRLSGKYAYGRASSASLAGGLAVDLLAGHAFDTTGVPEHAIHNYYPAGPYLRALSRDSAGAILASNGDPVRPAGALTPRKAHAFVEGRFHDKEHPCIPLCVGFPRGPGALGEGPAAVVKELDESCEREAYLVRRGDMVTRVASPSATAEFQAFSSRAWALAYQGGEAGYVLVYGWDAPPQRAPGWLLPARPPRQAPLYRIPFAGKLLGMAMWADAVTLCGGGEKPACALPDPDAGGPEQLFCTVQRGEDVLLLTYAL